MLYFWKGDGTRTSKTMFPSVWHANTQIQLHKYTNTVLVKFADRHYMCYIFEKVMVRGPQKQCSRLSNVQLHKYTNKVWRWCTEGDKKLSYKGQGSQVSVWKMQNPPCLLCLFFLVSNIVAFEIFWRYEKSIHRKWCKLPLILLLKTTLASLSVGID